MDNVIYGGSDIGYNDVLQDYDKIVGRLDTNGINVNPSSRLLLSRRILNNYINNYLRFGKKQNEGESIKLSEGIRDYFEIKRIVSSQQILNQQKLELNMLLSGAQTPSEDNLTQARDIQFQLYLSALFDNPNFTLTFGEPDLIIDLKEFKASVAIKRISSEKKIYTRVREAEKQIIESSIDGFIAISVEQLAGETDNYIVTNNPDNLAQACECILYTILKTNTSRELFNRDKSVIGIIVFVGMPAFIINGHIRFGYGSCLKVFPTVNRDDPRYEAIKEISKKLTA